MKPKNVCPKCSIKFSFKLALYKHIRLRHAKEKTSASALDEFSSWKAISRPRGIPSETKYTLTRSGDVLMGLNDYQNQDL